MNLTLTRPAATLSHPMGEGLGVRALFQLKFMAPMRVHVMCRCLLPMNRPSPGLAATLSHRMGEGLGVRALFQWKFMAPMRVHVLCRCLLPMNRPSGSSRRQEAHSTPNAFSGKKIRALRQAQGVPRDLGCYARLGWVHGPNARARHEHVEALQFEVFLPVYQASSVHRTCSRIGFPAGAKVRSSRQNSSDRP